MTMQKFIRTHRDDLKATIRGLCSNLGRLNDGDLEDWILNDEGLYNWARSEGVNV